MSNDDATEADHDFARRAVAAFDDVIAFQPDEATLLGDHRFDDRLADTRPETMSDYRATVGRHLSWLDELELNKLNSQNQVDAAMLRCQLEATRFELDELREYTWNPMLANPGRALYGLLARDFAPLPERLGSLAARLAAIPEVLRVSRDTLGAMPRAHIETARDQLAGTAELITVEVDRALEKVPSSRADVDAVRPAALVAIDEHRRWLAEKLAEGERDGTFRDPRIGPELFARRLALTLDTETDATAILARAEQELERVTEEITELAARRAGVPGSTPGIVARVLDEVAADAPDDSTILDLARSALSAQREFVDAQQIVTSFDDPVELIVMPEIDRGVAVAYCDPPGPLETADLPTFVAVSPTPRDWSPERVASFYREYNRHQVHNLMVHEAMPGHVLQLQHARRFTGSSQVRAAWSSGSFIEGWACYAERVMAELEYPGDNDPVAVRLQRLKMLLRSIINAILDARVHAGGMTEAEALGLMMDRGFQQEGEAVGKWRRVLLTSTQLSSYFVGYSEVGGLVSDLRRAHPDWSTRTVHDAVLAHGSPPVRRLRTLLPL